MKKTIEERVDRIERIFWVVGVIAVIFGVSGAWGYKLVKVATNEIITLRKKVEDIKPEIRKEQDEAIRKIEVKEKEAIGNLEVEEKEAIRRLTERAYKQLALVPTGAVMAFNLKTCPEGWEELRQARGRTVIGVGKGNGLTSRYLRESGGEEKHQMTIDELVPHSHKVHDTDQRNTPSGTDNTGKEYGNYFRDRAFTSPTGNGKPFNIMQPWVAYLYCEKL